MPPLWHAPCPSCRVVGFRTEPARRVAGGVVLSSRGTHFVNDSQSKNVTKARNRHDRPQNEPASREAESAPHRSVQFCFSTVRDMRQSHTACPQKLKHTDGTTRDRLGEVTRNSTHLTTITIPAAALGAGSFRISPSAHRACDSLYHPAFLIRTCPKSVMVCASLASTTRQIQSFEGRNRSPWRRPTYIAKSNPNSTPPNISAGRDLCMPFMVVRPLQNNHLSIHIGAAPRLPA